ncbi:MAG TPA: CHAD domain-containing protein, partial [Thermoanaerobaculaceae bacterium]|nr:CHAD domain-containing protein [Thermoanaerobaculaceae bacterium]
AATLASGLALAPDERDELTDAAAAAGRTPGDYTSKIVVRLAPDEPAERAVRHVLARLLRTLVANVEGTTQDLDTEFLHDLRVATRRTRTCLGQLGGVLPQAKVAPFAEEFRWLGAATTPCRDLDVFLLDLETRQRSRPAAALAPLLGHLRVSRDAVHRALADALGSERFRTLVRRWKRLLERRAPGGEDGLRPIAEVAGESAVRAYTRLVRHGLALAPEAEANAMHRLRIDAKKLRYILEFFASLWDGEETAALVRELKAVQDALGDYHDAWLQRKRLLELGDDMLAAGGAPTLLAMGGLAAELERRQAAEIKAFFARFETFAAEATHARFERLVLRPGGN